MFSFLPRHWKEKHTEQTPYCFIPQCVYVYNPLNAPQPPGSDSLRSAPTLCVW